MRAHANCIENLPVFGAIVLALCVGNVTSSLVNVLAIAVLVARIIQSLVHVCLVQTNTVASIRFGFFFVLLCLKVFSICASFQAAKAVSFSVLA
jgi:uncharacterized MAPEG superfamily protein